MDHSLNQWCSERQSRPEALADRRSPRLTWTNTVRCSAPVCGTCDTQSLLQGTGVLDVDHDRI